MASPRALLLTAQLVADPAAIDTGAQLSSCPAQQLSLLTRSGQLATASDVQLPASAFGLVVSLGAAGHHTPALLGAICKALQPGGRLVVQEPANGSAQATEEALKRNLLLAGFTGVEASTGAGALKVVASKPSWETGAKAAIALKPKAAPTAPANGAGSAAAAAWKFAADDDDELIDEDELLTEEDLKRPSVPAAADDCEVGASGRKACKNCSCGRAEAEAAGVKVELTQEMLDNPQSACGSCGLGDAFRCASCPYKGLPAFQPGKRIQLGSDLLAADL